jgi:hypothetical protein
LPGGDYDRPRRKRSPTPAAYRPPSRALIWAELVLNDSTAPRSCRRRASRWRASMTPIPVASHAQPFLGQMAAPCASLAASQLPHWLQMIQAVGGIATTVGVLTALCRRCAWSPGSVPTTPTPFGADGGNPACQDGTLRRSGTAVASTSWSAPGCHRFQRPSPGQRGPGASLGSGPLLHWLPSRPQRSAATHAHRCSCDRQRGSTPARRALGEFSACLRDRPADAVTSSHQIAVLDVEWPPDGVTSLFLRSRCGL